MYGSEFRVQVLGGRDHSNGLWGFGYRRGFTIYSVFRVIGYGVKCLVFIFSGSQDLGCKIWGLWSRVEGLGIRVRSLGFGVKGLGLRV